MNESSLEHPPEAPCGRPQATTPHKLRCRAVPIAVMGWLFSDKTSERGEETGLFQTASSLKTHLHGVSDGEFHKSCFRYGREDKEGKVSRPCWGWGMLGCSAKLPMQRTLLGDLGNATQNSNGRF